MHVTIIQRPSQVITIVDTTPPVIGAAGGNATIECTASPSFTPPTASDACNGATVNQLTDVNGSKWMHKDNHKNLGCDRCM
jgi:hypothetical protein